MKLLEQNQEKLNENDQYNEMNQTESQSQSQHLLPLYWLCGFVNFMLRAGLFFIFG